MTTQCVYLNTVIYMNISFNQSLLLWSKCVRFLGFHFIYEVWKLNSCFSIILYSYIPKYKIRIVSDNFQHRWYFKRLFASKLQRSGSNYLLKIIFRMAMLTHITQIPYKDKFLKIPKIPSIQIIMSKILKNSE